MDEIRGTTKRMTKVGNNLRKFDQLKGETSTLQLYHTELIEMRLYKINKTGNRTICRELGKKYNKSPDTIKSDLMIMKRYGVLNE